MKAPPAGCPGPARTPLPPVASPLPHTPLGFWESSNVPFPRLSAKDGWGRAYLLLCLLFVLTGLTLNLILSVPSPDLH